MAVKRYESNGNISTDAAQVATKDNNESSQN